MSAINGTTRSPGQGIRESSLNSGWISVPTIMQRLGAVLLIASAGLLTGYLFSAGSEFATACAVSVACMLFPLLCGVLFRFRRWTKDRRPIAASRLVAPRFVARRFHPTPFVPTQGLALSPDSQFCLADQMLLEDALLNSPKAPGSKYVM